MNDSYLADLGWCSFFQQQLTESESELAVPARVVEQHKGFITYQADGEPELIPLTPEMPRVTVGDWILLDQAGRLVRALDRKGGFRRRAAGPVDQEQWLAANVDIAFIVCSLNQDYNLNRIERYLSLVYEAGAEPVVVLSKEDLCEDTQAKVAEVRRLGHDLCVESVNCLDEDSAAKLLDWCKPGATVVMLGSSGAGKSTLTNTLLGEEYQETGEIREGDDKGRHTTTRRTLLPMENGAWILDTPGMRELQLSQCETGVAAAFADIESLAETCKFRDCRHQQEPGCAVQAALIAGRLSERRLNNYQKLIREQAHNAASIAQRRSGDKALSKMYKRVQSQGRRIKEG
jgi:ribosome biogenesis GTPase / thiamine phosphate phosphatase